MARKKHKIRLEIPAELRLTSAEKAAIKNSIRVQVTDTVERKNYGSDQPPLLEINVPQTALPKRASKPKPGSKKSGGKSGSSKNQ